MHPTLSKAARCAWGVKGRFWVVAVRAFHLKPMILPETYTVETVRPNYGLHSVAINYGALRLVA